MPWYAKPPEFKDGWRIDRKRWYHNPSWLFTLWMRLRGWTLDG